MYSGVVSNDIALSPAANGNTYEFPVNLGVQNPGFQQNGALSTVPQEYETPICLSMSTKPGDLLVASLAQPSKSQYISMESDAEVLQHYNSWRQNGRPQQQGRNRVRMLVPIG